MLNSRLIALSLFSLVLSSNVALAKDIPVQARLFLGATSVDPKNANETVEAVGLKKIDAAPQYGVEITYPLLRFLDVGMRYSKKIINNEEPTPDITTDYSVNVDQDSVLLLARVPFVKSEFLRVDAFAGFGGSNTTLKLRSASQNGDLTRTATQGWFATPYTAAGGSVAIGFKQVYLVFEGGIESNKVDSFERTGSVSSSLETVDLSGSYFSIGLMFDGVPGSVK